MKIVCDNCGASIHVEVINRKGQGAAYAKNIKKLGKARTMILDILAEAGAISQSQSIPKKVIAARIYARGVKMSGNAISGRLSELLGLKYVKMVHRQIKLHHPSDEFKFRFKRIPCWYLYEKEN